MSDFNWLHFQGKVILRAVREYYRYAMSCRDPEQMIGERGVVIDHSTIYHWVQKYAPEIEEPLSHKAKRSTDDEFEPLQPCWQAF